LRSQKISNLCDVHFHGRLASVFPSLSFHDYDCVPLLPVIMPFSSPPRSPRLFIPDYFRLIITGGDFQRQCGRFLGFCLAPNGSAHAVTTGHANVLLDSGVVVIIPTYFLRPLTPDATSPFL
jgi:hypothetical protein